MVKFGHLAVILATVFRLTSHKQPAQKRFDDQFFTKAAVVTNSFDCTNIGIDILQSGGSVADSAIAALLCDGVSNPQSMGIGGGFILTIYVKDRGKAEILNARECAPKHACKDMFGPLADNDIASGGLAVAVPGELRGYWALHRKYGKMKWCDLFKPTIALLERGVYVSKYMAKMLEAVRTEIVNSPSLNAIFLNRKTGELYKEGDMMYRPMLLQTLQKIAEKGPDYLYNGPLTDCFVQDIADQGGIITKDDMKQYRPMWMKALKTSLPKDLMAFTPPSPAPGSSMLIILDVVSQMLSNGNPLLFWHRIIEAWKYGYGLKTQMCGPMMGSKVTDHCYNSTVTQYIRCKIKDSKTYNTTRHYFGVYEDTGDYGTGHISILAPNGDAISVTSTINLGFGALFASPSTGIILNNEMLDFAIPGHHPWKANPANYIKPSKQPTSSMCPTIIVNKHDDTVRMVVGASGGFKILSSTSLVIIRHLWFGDTLEDAICQSRLHHQLKPNVVEYEEDFPKDILRGLCRKGHVLKKIKNRGDCGLMDMPINSAVNGISVENGEIHAMGDERRGAYADGY